MVENLRLALLRIRPIILAFASTRMATGLCVAIIAATAVGTVVEAVGGHANAQWFVYHSTWFLSLLGLLACHILCAVLFRLSWRQKRGTILVYAGLLTLLAGSALTFTGGIDGQLTLLEGNSTDQLTVNDLSQITVSWADRPQERPYVFTFDSGPVDWRRGTELDLGRVDGLGARVLSHYRFAQPLENLVADPDGRGGPLIRFELSSAAADGTMHGGMQAGKPLAGSLADFDYGAEVFVGPIAVRLQRAVSDAMLADFLQPSRDRLGEKGVLTAYYQDTVKHVTVDEHVGTPVQVGKSGATVEVVQYLANAKLDAGGQFKSIGTEPRNPLVELKVSLPSDDKPFRQVAFAKSPMLNFDGVYGRDCPVKFTYQHPQLKPGAAVEFMQGRDGKLFGRTIADGNYKPLGEITVGKRIDVKSGFALALTEYAPHSRCDVSFQRIEHAENGSSHNDAPAAQVEIAVSGVTRKLWLQRNEAGYDVGTIDTPEGPLRVQFTTARMPLGFKLELVDLQQGNYLGRGGDANLSSVVRITDKKHSSPDQRTIAASQSTSHDGYHIRHTGVRDVGHGKQASTFAVTYDPGRSLKYLGSAVICVGIFVGCRRRHSQVYLATESTEIAEKRMLNAA